MLNLSKKILVAIDGSPQSDKAAEEAVRMAADNRSPFKSRIYAMLVLPNTPATTYTDFIPKAPLIETEKWDDLRQRIFYVIEKCALESDVPLEMIVEYGEPVDKLLVAVGRAPNVAGLNLEAAGVAYDIKAGIRVDDHLRTTNPRVFAA